MTEENLSNKFLEIENQLDEYEKLLSELYNSSKDTGEYNTEIESKISKLSAFERSISNKIDEMTPHITSINKTMHFNLLLERSLRLSTKFTSIIQNFVIKKQEEGIKQYKQELAETKEYINQMENKTDNFEEKCKKDEHCLRIGISILIFLFLIAQFVVLVVFLFKNHEVLPPKYLTPILLAIAGQSYFLPSFMAKYLFNNDGVTTQNSQTEQSKDFKGFGFDFKWYK